MGILIRMFFYDTDKHHVPHIRAEYQGQVAVYAIEDGALAIGSYWKQAVPYSRAGSMTIQQVTPKEGFILHVVAENGASGEFDVSPYLEAEAFEPLKSPEKFKKICNGKYFIEWECGADLSEDTIEAHLR